jgi:hypothetical protein
VQTHTSKYDPTPLARLKAVQAILEDTFVHDPAMPKSSTAAGTTT